MNAQTQPPVAKMLSGRPLRDALLADVKAHVATMKIKPHLAVIQVGDNPASTTYVARKLSTIASLGMTGERIHIRADEGEALVRNMIHSIGIRPDVTAVIVQLPLPDGWAVQPLLDIVPAHKDCDGLNTANAALRHEGQADAILPATPLGILRLLESINQPLIDVSVAVVGKGLVVGLPLREMLIQRGARVIEIDRDTPHPQALAREADVLISATGVPHLINEHWVKPSAVVIDVGLSRMIQHDGTVKLVGDIDPVRVASVAGWLTPVPGGVGPLTVASLMTNILQCAGLQGL